MSRYIKSGQDSRELRKTIDDLKTNFKSHKNSVDKNTKELSKINDEIKLNKEEEVKLLSERIRKLETQTQWIENDEPALEIDSQDMLKRLDIL